MLGPIQSCGFDHCYRPIENSAVYRDLAERGFLLDSTIVRHPGRLVCQFLHFQNLKDDTVYLEFIYRDLSLKEDSGSANEEDLPAGFALNCTEKLQLLVDQAQQTFPAWKPVYTHKNYDWLRDNSSILPGWNFLSFEKFPITNIYVWLIEYEAREFASEEARQAKARERDALSLHPNSVRKIIGFVWNASSPDTLSTMSKLFAAPLLGQSLDLSDRSKLIGLTPSDQEFSLFEEKTSDFFAVIVGVESLEVFIASARPDAVVNFKGQKAALVRLGSEGWDLLALEQLPEQN